MKTLSIETLLSEIQLDSESTVPLYKQLYQQLHQAIVEGKFPPGIYLQSTRDLSKILKVSRNTVLQAIQQLIAEGFLEAKAGSGTRITSNLPRNFFWKDYTEQTHEKEPVSIRSISRRGETYAAGKFTNRQKMDGPYIFTLSVPALDHFPVEMWSRLVARHHRKASLNLFDYNVGEPAGYQPLREAIANYVQVVRGVKCTAEQVIITNGAQHAIFLATQVLLDPGDKVWLENPGHIGTRSILQASNAKIVSVPVDNHGLNVEAGIRLAPDASMVCITPHQMPVGSLMNLKRRLELLRWAREEGAWILEDDYDHEFTYRGRPIMSLQGLDNANRVIYIGTFSKSMFPSLRIGYMIVPHDLVQPLSMARLTIDVQTSTIQQAALADFIHKGYLSNHIRRMRKLYGQRRNHLLKLLSKELSEWVTPGIATTGFHMMAWLHSDISDKVICEEGRKHGLSLVPVSNLYIGKALRSGLLLGYAATDEENMTKGVMILKKILQEYSARPS